MAYGVPVIAYYSGGLSETVIEDKTDVFFREYTHQSLVDTINRFEKMSFDPIECYRQSLKFSDKKFRRKIRQLIIQRYEKQRKEFDF